MNAFTCNDLEGILELSSAHLDAIVCDYLDGVQVQEWRPIQPHRLNKILQDYARTGLIRDDVGLYIIAGSILNLLGRLYANCYVMEHTPSDPEREIREIAENMGCASFDYDDFNEWVVNYVVDEETNQWRITDFAFDTLGPLSYSLTQTESPEEALSIISQICNVMHMRSDLSRWFIEGGKDALTEMGNFGQQQTG